MFCNPLNVQKEREKERNHFGPKHVRYLQRFFGLSEYDYTRKMLHKDDLGKVSSKAAER